MENEQNPKKFDKGSIIILSVIAAVIIAVVVYFVVQGLGGNGKKEAQPPENMGEIIELNALNLYGTWNKEMDGLTAQLSFKTDKSLSYKELDAEGNVTAKSENGSFDVADGKLSLTIFAYGETVTELCTAYVSDSVVYVAADDGSTGFFDGLYARDGESPDGSATETEPVTAETTASETTTTAAEAAKTTTAETTTTTAATTTTTAATTTTTAVTTTTTTTAVTTEPSAQEEYHLPEAVINSFDLTIEEFFANAGYVPLCDKYEDLTDYVDLIQPGNLEFYEENGFKFKIAFYPGTTSSGTTIHLGFDGNESWNGDVVGVGQTLMVKCNPSFLFPETDDVTYEFMVNKFGDKLGVELENTDKYRVTPYLIYVDVDGYRIFLDKFSSLETQRAINAYVIKLSQW